MTGVPPGGPQRRGWDRGGLHNPRVGPNNIRPLALLSRVCYRACPRITIYRSSRLGYAPHKLVGGGDRGVTVPPPSRPYPRLPCQDCLPYMAVQWAHRPESPLFRRDPHFYLTRACSCVHSIPWTRRPKEYLSFIVHPQGTECKHANIPRRHPPVYANIIRP